MPRFFTRKKTMDTQAEPKIDEAKTEPVEDQTASVDAEIETKSAGAIKITNKKVAKLMGSDEGQFVEDINEYESKILINGKVRKINKSDYEII